MESRAAGRSKHLVRHFAFVFALLSCAACPAPSSPNEGASSSATGSPSSGSVGDSEVGEGTDAGDSTTSGAMDTTAPQPCEATLSSIQATIFAPSCNTDGCHDASSAAAGLDLAATDLSTRLVGTPAATCPDKVLVSPGDPGSSFLFEKLDGTPSCGVQMPVNAPALTSAQLECIAEWIEGSEQTCETCGTDVCIDTVNDPLHCGECDSPCPAGSPCNDGACECPEGTSLCAGECVDVLSDPQHCGGCDTPCEDGLFCLAGGCGSDCAGLDACDGACVDLSSNPLHCGGCDSPCGLSDACSAGSCSCDAAPLSYAEDIEPLFVEGCTSMGCHGSGPMPAQEGLRLSIGDGYDNLVGVVADQCGGRLLVEPGQPNSSYLLDKILGINLCSGTKMPKMGAGLSTEESDMVSQWICSGAAP